MKKIWYSQWPTAEVAFLQVALTPALVVQARYCVSLA